jgi:hypothetical protein
MYRIRLILIGCLLGTGMLVASAQTIKPGLWEMRSKAAGGSPEQLQAMAEAQKHLESLPPEQRKKMADLMAKQGISTDGPGSGAFAKVCLTQEMIDRNQMVRQPTSCKQTSLQKIGNAVKFSVVCSDPPSSAEGVVTHASAEAFTSQMTVRITRDGKPETLLLESSGKFLSASCDGVKPMGGLVK